MKKNLNAQALNWLTTYDPEFDWRAYDRNPTHGRDYVGAVRDNIRSFGVKPLGRMSRDLRRAVLA